MSNIRWYSQDTYFNRGIDEHFYRMMKTVIHARKLKYLVVYYICIHREPVFVINDVEYSCCFRCAYSKI